jgi:hypothetical protein
MGRFFEPARRFHRKTVKFSVRFAYPNGFVADTLK